MNLNRRAFLKLATCGAAAGLAGTYPVLIERSTVLTTRHRIPVPNLPPSFEGLRIVHLTDIHHGLLVSDDFVRNIVRRANHAGGDLIVCTGDYVHARRSTREIDAVWPLLAELRAPLGVYSVLGNHDHWANTQRSLHWLERTGQHLYHRKVPLARGRERVWLAGAGDLWESHRGLDEELAGVPENDCRIVLAHNPDTADSPSAQRVDLMISGHTHGGQIVFPFIGAPVLPVRNKSYSSGLKKSPSGTPVFISRGIGWAIVPVRMNCFPEIAVLELTRAVPA